MSCDSRLLTLTAAVLSVTAVVAALGQGAAFELRTGQWQMTVAGFDVPAAALEKVPPAARAQLQTEMNKPHTSSSCISADDLKNLNIGRTGDGDDADCKVTSRSVSRTTADFTRVCTGDDKRTDVMHLEAPTPTAFKASIRSTTPDGTVTMTMTGTWMSATCKEEQ